MTGILETNSGRRFWITLSLDLALCGHIPVSVDNAGIDKLGGRIKTSTSLPLMQKGYKPIEDIISRQSCVISPFLIFLTCSSLLGCPVLPVHTLTLLYPLSYCP